MADSRSASVVEEFLPAPYPAPLFVAWDEHLDFGEVRQPAQKRLTLKVSNIGGDGNLEVSLLPNIPNQQWFRVRPAHLVIPAGEDRIVDVEIDTSQELCPLGEHELDIQVEAPGSMEREIPRIRVSVEVLREIVLVCDPGEIDLGEVPLGESRTVTVSIQRSDEREVCLNERLIQLVDETGKPRPAWADIELGAPGRKQEVTLTFHTANRAMREYRCELRLCDTVPEVNPVDVPIRVSVSPPPQLQVEWVIPPMPNFSGDFQDAQLAVGNSGGGVLRGRIAGDQHWLRVLNGEFSVAAGQMHTATVRIGDARLRVGTYHGHLEIFSNDGGRSRVLRVPIELEVVDRSRCPVEIYFEPDLGALHRRQTAERALTITNPMAQPFEGRLISGSPDWIRVKGGMEEVRLGPGESRQLLLEVDPRRLPAQDGPTRHKAALQLVDSTGKERWKKTATLELVPAPSSPLVRLLLAFWALVLLAGLAWGGKQVYDGPVQRLLSARTRAATVATPAPAPAAPPAQQQAATARPAPAQPAPESQSAPEATEKPRRVAPDSARARSLYAEGTAHFQRGEWRLAADLFDQAAAVDPAPAGSLLMVGRSRYHLGEWDAAAKALEEATRLKPDSAAAHLWLGRVYLEQGNREAASREFEAALKADPMNRQARDELQKLR